MNNDEIIYLQDALKVEKDGDIGPITRKAYADKLVTIAKKEIGVHEIGDTNTGKRVQEYQSTTSLEGTGWPWCAAFICFLFKVSMMFTDENRPKTASAYGYESWGKSVGLNVVKDPKSIKRGDIVIFDFSHIGLATSDSDKNGKFSTIEGNTSCGVAGSQRDGGGVYERTRSITSIRSVVRL